MRCTLTVTCRRVLISCVADQARQPIRQRLLTRTRWISTTSGASSSSTVSSTCAFDRGLRRGLLLRPCTGEPFDAFRLPSVGLRCLSSAMSQDLMTLACGTFCNN